MIPRHVNPLGNQAATAPYNFVPLPNAILTVENGVDVMGEKLKLWQMHDQFVPGTNSGWIDLSIETLTPMFIRGAVTKASDGNWDDRETRLRLEPYAVPDGRLAIPGSSLRGMLRGLVEILSFSKIQPVGDAKPFYRTVADDRIGKVYTARMTRGNRKPSGGILRIQERFVSIEPREVVRVKRSVIEDRDVVRFTSAPNTTPPWPPQHSKCWVKVQQDSTEARDWPDAVDITLRIPIDRGAWIEGRLVLTGYVPLKQREFVFLEPQNASGPDLTIPERILKRFNDDDQITQWQAKAFPRDKPTPDCRRAPGYLTDGEPVFYLTDEREKSDENPDGIVFLGRAGMFRLPYDVSPKDILPESARSDMPDIAEAMFGTVCPDKQIKSRIFVEDAVCKETKSDCCGEIIVPRILSSPKPTAFQQYLTQDSSRGKLALTTYINGDVTTIRGHKLYWHRTGGDGVDLAKESAQNHNDLRAKLLSPAPQDTQHTIMKPVKTGVNFIGRIRFENLSDLELGALLSAIELPKGCYHKIGMAKPLGMGSIRITASLNITEREARYRSWHAGAERETVSDERFANAFLDTLLVHSRDTSETLLPEKSGLCQIARLDVLFQLLSWDNRPAASSTDYMPMSGFRYRPVLPTPHAVEGAKEPSWQAEAPRPASSQQAHRSESPSELDRGRYGPSRAKDELRRSLSETPAPRDKIKPVEKGQTREGILRQRQGDYYASFEGEEREAQIDGRGLIPIGVNDGARAEFYILEQSKKKGIRCRFEKLL